MTEEIDGALFSRGEYEYRRGDSRPLAEWVREHEHMTSEQREFLAQVITGDVSREDLRKINKQTEQILDFYDSAKKWRNFLRSQQKVLTKQDLIYLSDAYIYRSIAKYYGYDDVDSVRRTVARHRTRKKIVS